MTLSQLCRGMTAQSPVTAYTYPLAIELTRSAALANTWRSELVTVAACEWSRATDVARAAASAVSILTNERVVEYLRVQYNNRRNWPFCSSKCQAYSSNTKHKSRIRILRIFSFLKFNEFYEFVFWLKKFAKNSQFCKS